MKESGWVGTPLEFSPKAPAIPSEAARSAGAVAAPGIAATVTERYVKACQADPDLRLALRQAPLPPLFADSFGKRLLSRPMFIEESAIRAFADDLATIFRLLVSLPARIFDGDMHRYCAAVGIPDRPATLMMRGATGRPPLFARPDAYHDGKNFRLLEFNLGSELGGMEFAAINRGLLQVQAFRDFAEENGLRFVDTAEIVAGVLRELAAPVAQTERPVVALMETTGGIAAHPIYRAVQEAMVRWGIDFRLGEVQDVRLEGGKLFLDDAPIDITLRFYAPSEILGCPRGPDVLEPIYRADENGKTLLFTRLESSLYCSKGGLAVLSDDRFRSVFDQHERTVIDRVIPWTRSLTTEQGNDLIDICRANRLRLIIKRCTGWGGAGAVVGSEVSDERWKEVLLACVNRGYVVQEIVRPVSEPVCDPETERVESWQANWGVFVTPHGYAGTMVRALKTGDGTVIALGNPGSRLTSVFTVPDGHR